LLLIACAEVGGASMVKFRLELSRWMRSVMLAHPATHGLVGVRDVDEQILDEALVKFDAGLRLFHMQAEGMGLVIIGTTMVAVMLVASPVARQVIVWLLTASGASYPLGYLLWSALIPSQGIERVKTTAEWVFWIPFGGATILVMGGWSRSSPSGVSGDDHAARARPHPRPRGRRHRHRSTCRRAPRRRLHRP